MWTEVTEDDILSALTSAEMGAYRRASVKDGQNPLQQAIESSVTEMRGRIAACDRNRLAPGMTVPPEVLHHLLATIRYRFLSRLPISISDERTKEFDKATAFARDVSRCDVAVEQPPAGDVSPADYSGPVSPCANPSPGREFGRDAQDGI
ncbi:MAG: hypothetical protein ACPHCN_11865 [Mycobacterium sp.]